MYESIANQRIVITGITGGIAFASAKLLAALGAEVIVTARNQAKLDETLSSIDGTVSGYVMDLKDEKSIKAVFESIGSFDHLVTPAASSVFTPLSEMDFKAARDLVETKLWGQLLCAHYALKHLSKTGSMTLFSGTVTQKPLSGGSIFAAVGGGSEAAGRVWALENAPIRVNTIVPGVIDTPIWDVLMGTEAAEAAKTHFSEILPARRVGTADDVAKGVLFLIDNSFVNGLSLVIDGGHRLI